MHWVKKNNYVLVFSFLTLFTYIILFASRSLDDNRLTSWQWAFADINAAKVVLILIFGIISAYIFSKVSFLERHHVICLFLFSYISAALFWREPEVIVDASRYFTQAKHLEVYGIRYFIEEWGRDISIWTDMPVVPFLYGLIFKFFGESRLYIQIFTTFLFSMTVVLTYLIGKTLWSEDIGFSGGMFLLGIPYIFVQTSLMLVDIPTMFFFTFSIFVFIDALKRGGILMIMLSSITIFFAFFSKYSTWLMMSVLVVIYLVYVIQKSKNASNPQTPNYIYRVVLITSISALLIGIFFLYKLDVFSEQIRLLITYQKPGLRKWGESYISTFFFQIHPFITIAALYSIYTAFRKRDLKYLIIIWLALLIILLQVNRIRYIMMIFPMFALMASYGLQEIKNKELRRFIVLCAVISSLVIAIFVYLPFVQKISTVNLKNTGEFLDSLDVEAVEVFTPPSTNSIVNPAVSVPILDLFTKKRIYYDYNPDLSQSSEDIGSSALRFTWEYKNPKYYTPNNRISEENMAVVIISKDTDESLPNYIQKKIDGYRNSRVFGTSEELFQYRTIIRIFW